MLTDLDDADARRLLHEAADTIDVASAGPLAVPPHRPWWPALAAAAAVAAVATGLAVGLWGGEPTPAPAPPAATREPAAGRPAVFGYSAGDAALLLHDLGYVVDVQVVRACETAGRAVGVRWGRNERVTVLESDGGVFMDCVRPIDADRADAWELLDLVSGRDSDLDLARTVRMYDATTGRHGRPVESSRVARWPSVVEALSVPAGSELQASLFTRRAVDASCGVLPPDLRDRPGVLVSVRVPDASPNCRSVTLFRDAGEVVAMQVSPAMTGG